MKIERTKNATRNIAFGMALRVYQMLVPFLMRTVMIYFMGVQYLGLNSLFTSILQVLNLAELGIGSAMVYSMYKPIAEDDEITICALMKMYKIYYRVIGCVVAGIGLLAVPLLPHLVKGEIPQELNLYILYFLNLTATVFSYWLFSYKNSLLMAHQRTDVTSKISLGINTVQFIVQFLTLYLFRNYYLYLVTMIVSQITNNVVTSCIVSRMYPKYVAKGKLNPEVVKSINGRIKDLFIAKVGGVVLNSVDTIVISAFLGLTVLAVYQNYYFIISSVCGIMEVILTSITAGLGNSYITETKEKNFSDMQRISYLFFWIIGVCTSCFLGIFQPFMNIWVGEKFIMPFSMVLCFCSYFYVYETTRLLNVFKNAGGIWHEDRFRPLISAVFNLTLNLISVRYLGIYGIVLSTIIALVVIEIPWLFRNIFTVLYQKNMMPGYLRLFLSWVVATIVSCVAIGLILESVNLSKWLQFIVAVMISAIIPNIIFIIIMHRMPEFRSSLELVNRITHGKIRLIRKLCD